MDPKYNDYVTELSGEYKNVAYRIVRGKDGFKSIKMSDIKKVCREVRRSRVKKVVAYVSKNGRICPVTLQEASL